MRALRLEGGSALLLCQPQAHAQKCSNGSFQLDVQLAQYSPEWLNHHDHPDCFLTYGVLVLQPPRLLIPPGGMEETICWGISWVVGYPLFLSVSERGQGQKEWMPIDVLRNKNCKLALLL